MGSPTAINFYEAAFQIIITIIHEQHKSSNSQKITIQRINKKDHEILLPPAIKKNQSIVLNNINNLLELIRRSPFLEIRKLTKSTILQNKNIISGDVNPEASSSGNLKRLTRSTIICRKTTENAENLNLLPLKLPRYTSSTCDSPQYIASKFQRPPTQSSRLPFSDISNVSGARSSIFDAQLQIGTSNFPQSEVQQMATNEVSFVDLTGDNAMDTDCQEYTIEYHDHIATDGNEEIINLVDDDNDFEDMPGNIASDIMRFCNPSSFNIPFGGKTIVFGGDFCQILLVIPKGSRQDVVHATINSSYLWTSCTVLKLTKNMRLQNMCSNDEFIQSDLFAKWIASIGDGVIGGPNDGEASIDLPEDILLKYSEDPIATIVDYVYPSDEQNIDIASYLQERAILAPTLDVVEAINQYMVSLNTSEGRSYLSSDTTCKSESIFQDIHTPEFLNSLKCSSIPNHELFLKVGTPVMLLRNIDHANGLCNGTRLVITRLSSHVLEAKVLDGHKAGYKVLIPRLSLTPSDLRLPFKFQRRQFPVIVSYAMTINKSQGQSLSRVGLFLKKSVFTHDQLYVDVSRVTSRNGLKILV